MDYRRLKGKFTLGSVWERSLDILVLWRMVTKIPNISPNRTNSKGCLKKNISMGRVNDAISEANDT